MAMWAHGAQGNPGEKSVWGGRLDQGDEEACEAAENKNDLVLGQDRSFTK